MGVYVCERLASNLCVSGTGMGDSGLLVIILHVSVLRGHFTRCCPCHLKEKMESRGRPSLEPDKYRCKIWFES